MKAVQFLLDQDVDVSAKMKSGHAYWFNNPLLPNRYNCTNAQCFNFIFNIQLLLKTNL